MQPCNVWVSDSLFRVWGQGFRASSRGFCTRARLDSASLFCSSFSLRPGSCLNQQG